MDRFSEQLIIKQTVGRDIVKRLLIITGASVIAAGVIILFMLFGLGLLMPGLAIIAADAWLAKFLIEGTFTEYEYIVTNDDLDIDKILGRRKRKRLITLSLSKVTELGAYSEGVPLSSDVTVIAHDESGTGMWYVIADSDKYGKLAVVFNPNKRTIENMVGGFAPAIKAKYLSLIKTEEPAPAEQSTDTGSDKNTDSGKEA